MGYYQEEQNYQDDQDGFEQMMRIPDSQAPMLFDWEILQNFSNNAMDLFGLYEVKNE